MGGTQTCQYKNCNRERTMQCKCSGIMLCEKCTELHKRQNPFITHNVVPLSSESNDSGEISVRTLEYHESLYRSPEGATEVFRGSVRGRSEKVAIKIMYSRNREDLAKKQEEASLMQAMTHPNICGCLASFLDESYTGGFKFIIVMEFSELGDLEQEIDMRNYSKDRWEEKEALKHITELIDAFCFLQDADMVHGDIKPRNLFLTASGKIKIGDFGESRHGMQAMVTRTHQVSGTVIYFSPLQFKAYVDIIKGKNVSADVRHNPVKSDVYSLGLTFLHMLSLSKPSELNNLELGAAELQNLVDTAIAQLEYSNTVKQILSRMLQVEEYRRYNFRQLKPFVEGLLTTPQPAARPAENRIASPRRQRSESTFITEPCLVSLSQTKGKANIYEIQADKFSKISNIKFDPSSRVLEFNKSIIITGGLKTPKMVMQVDLNGTNPQNIVAMNYGRSFHCVVFFQESIVVIGGKGHTKRSILRECERLETEQWGSFPPLNVGRENASAITIGQCIYVVGGSTNANGRINMLNSIEKFTEGKWEVIDTVLPSKTIGVGILQRTEDELLVVGGIGEKGEHKKECYRWALESNFEPIEDLPEADVFFQNASMYQHDKCFFLGSMIGVFSYDTAWEFKPF